MTRHISHLLAVGALALAAFSGQARADLIWNFSYTGGPFPDTYGPFNGDPNQYDHVSGQLTTANLNPASNTYTVVGISGIDNGSTITGLDPAAGETDNSALCQRPLSRFRWLQLHHCSRQRYQPYYNASNNDYWDWYDRGQTIVENGVFTVTPALGDAPEPATFALLGAGLVGFALLQRKPARIRAELTPGSSR